MSAPSPQQIQAWKEEYGNIFSVEVMPNSDYIFRSLTAVEQDRFFQLGERSMSAAEESVVESALLYPKITEEEIGNLPAGMVSALAEEILDYSGWTNPKYAISVLDEKRSKAQELQYLMKAFIVASMPSYKEEDLDSLTFHQLCHKVALSEQIIKLQQESMGLEGSIRLDLTDPEEEAREQERQLRKGAATKKPGQAGPGDEIAAKLHQALGG